MFLVKHMIIYFVQKIKAKLYYIKENIYHYTNTHILYDEVSDVPQFLTGWFLVPCTGHGLYRCPRLNLDEGKCMMHFP